MVNTEIHVDEYIAHSADLAPGDFWMLYSEFLWNSTRCLADDLKMMDDPCLNKLIIIESFASCASVFENARYRFLDIA